MLDVGAHHGRTDLQLSGDLGTGEPSTNEREDPSFARGQALRAVDGRRSLDQHMNLRSDS